MPSPPATSMMPRVMWLHRMLIQAKAGFEREMLDAMVEQALSTWPGA